MLPVYINIARIIDYIGFIRHLFRLFILRRAVHSRCKLMGQLTTHVLDTANGCPGANIRIELFAIDVDSRRHLKTTTTNADGRCDEPLLVGTALQRGVYELVFAAGDYFAARQPLPQPRFLDQVVIRFGVAEPDQHYHVPLLISPYGYSSYRGS